MKSHGVYLFHPKFPVSSPLLLHPPFLANGTHTPLAPRPSLLPLLTSWKRWIKFPLAKAIPASRLGDSCNLALVTGLELDWSFSIDQVSRIWQTSHWKQSSLQLICINFRWSIMHKMLTLNVFSFFLSLGSLCFLSGCSSCSPLNP